MKVQRCSGASGAAIPTVVVAVLAAGFLASGRSATAEIPEALENIVFGDEKRPVIERTINGTTFDTLSAFSDHPALLWIDDADPAPFERYRAAAQAWLDHAASVLGYDGFATRFRGVFAWRWNEVWTYDLVRRDLPLHDARVEIHWLDGVFLGIAIHTPGNILAIDDRAVPAGEEWVYYPVRDNGSDYHLEVARVERTDLGDRVEISITVDGRRVRRIAQKPAVKTAVLGASFDEYVMPAGIFPDQVSFDDEGTIWLSQPNNNLVTEFDPRTAGFQQYPTVGGSTPDGLIVGSLGRVWTGLYNSGQLGMWDSIGGSFHTYAAPYPNANMAVPVETSDGHVWVTDHLHNRVSEFDPGSGAFLQSLVMPTGNCWVVQGHEDPDTGLVYYTEYNANQLGYHAVGGSSVTDIPTPGGGPAFCVVLDGKVYYTRWTEAGIGVYDIATEAITEYQFPVAGEVGGPMWLTPGGDVVAGTRNIGYIMVFHPDTETFDEYQIPTSFPGLKDGLTVDAEGTIWFTEGDANKLGKLVLSPPCVGDVDGSGSVGHVDLLRILATWGTCPGCPEDLDGDGNVGFSDLLLMLDNWGACP